MNILQLQDQLKGLSQDQLIREMQMPSGSAPQYLVLSEITRRKKMEADMASQQQRGPQRTVAEEAIAAAGVPQAGLGRMAMAMAPQTDMMQNTGVGQMLPPGMPSEAPVMGMADGGYVRGMAEGGIIVRNGKQYRELPNGQLIELAEERSWGQRNIGDPLRSFFQPIGDSLEAVGQPVGDYMESVGQPVGTYMEAVGQPVGDYLESIGQPIGAAAPEFVLGPATPSADPYYASLMREENPRMGASLPVVPPRAGEEFTRTAPRGAGLTTTGFVPQGLDGNTPEWLGGVFSGVGDFVGALAGRTVEEQRKIEAERAAEAARESTESIAAAAALSAEDAAAARDAAGITESLRSPEEVKDAVAAAKKDPDAPPGGPEGPRGPGGGGAGGSAAAGMSSYEQEIMEAIERSEKRATQDKWLALAQAGMEIMSAASRQGTFAGAVGEGGAKGLSAFRQGRDEAENTRLALLKELEGSRMARAQLAARGGGGGGGLSIRDQIALAKEERSMLIDYLATLPVESADAIAVQMRLRELMGLDGTTVLPSAGT